MMQMLNLILLAACALSLSAEESLYLHFDRNEPSLKHVRCAMSESEVSRADAWGWLNLAGESTSWTGILIYYPSGTEQAEVSRCIEEIAQSKATQRYLKSFIDAVHRAGYKGQARQWQIFVAGKVVSFLGVPNGNP